MDHCPIRSAAKKQSKHEAKHEMADAYEEGRDTSDESGSIMRSGPKCETLQEMSLASTLELQTAILFAVPRKNHRGVRSGSHRLSIWASFTQQSEQISRG